MNGALALLVFAGGFVDEDQGLDAYVGRDLTKLSTVEAKHFKERLQEIVHEKPDPDAWQNPSPRWIKKYRIGQTEWILLELAEAMSIPGSGTVKVFGFTRDWTKTFDSTFSTGYRLTPTKVELLELPFFVQPILRIHVESLGPFIVVEGQKSKPLFHPDSGMLLDIAFGDQGGYLIRLATGNGELIGNSFTGGFAACGGPEVRGRNASAWKADLNAADPVRQLYAIIWLSSNHLNSKDWRKPGFAREPAAWSLCFESLRADASVIARLKTLQKSPNKWVSEQASFALKNLAKPLAPIEDPPNWVGPTDILHS